eukprot:768177-Hanusia_phi.AAC.11
MKVSYLQHWFSVLSNFHLQSERQPHANEQRASERGKRRLHSFSLARITFTHCEAVGHHADSLADELNDLRVPHHLKPRHHPPPAPPAPHLDLLM